MFELAGVGLEIETPHRLSPEEHSSLARLRAGGDAGAGDPAVPRAHVPFRLELTGEPWTRTAGEAEPAGQPASVEWRDGLVHVRHATFMAEIDAVFRRGRLWRGTPEAYPLEITLRVAVSTFLPLQGGLPVHAAGLVGEAGAMVFFGPSGAGKSTLAGLSPWPVLSDELVAVVASPLAAEEFAAVTTGFWGTLGEGDAPPGAFPLAAVIELAKGRALAIERLSPATALRRLIPTVLVPSGPPIWEAALAVLGRLVARVPAYRMAWSPEEPPWDGLRALQSRIEESGC